MDRSVRFYGRGFRRRPGISYPAPARGTLCALSSRLRRDQQGTVSALRAAIERFASRKDRAGVAARGPQRSEIRQTARVVCGLRRRRNDPDILHSERRRALLRATGEDLDPARVSRSGLGLRFGCCVKVLGDIWHRAASTKSFWWVIWDVTRKQNSPRAEPLLR